MKKKEPTMLSRLQTTIKKLKPSSHQMNTKKKRRLKATSFSDGSLLSIFISLKNMENVQSVSKNEN